ncbi:histidine phosphatase family protein [candidate division KSB1 bacterium]|nr:histidine phosphatase family protein [candidate division KSB1 bacterium]
MKVIYLLRHGKAEVGSALQSDKERRLISRGQKETRKTAKQFLLNGWVVGHVVTSPASRAAETAEIFCQTIGRAPAQIEKDDLIYNADAGDLFKLLQKNSNQFSSVLLVGHNPTFTDLAEMLSSSFHQHIPTGGLVAIRFNVESWKMLRAGQGEVLGTIFPKVKEDRLKEKDHTEQLQQAVARSIEQTLLNLGFPIREQERELIRYKSERLVAKLLKSLQR